MGEDDKLGAEATMPEDESCHITQKELLAVVGDKAARKLEARRAKDKSIWFGLGMFGMIGWSVAIPTLLGLTLGIWLDRQWPVAFSWTLTLLFGGIVLGCLNAWFWVMREREWIEPTGRSAPLPAERPVAREQEQDDD